MGVDQFATEAGVGNRRARRARVLLAAKLETPFGEIDVRLRDLSRKGALLECSPAPSVGTEVVFRRSSIAVPARVAWAATGKIGIEFLYMIDEADVMVQLKRPGGSASQTRFRRPGIKESASDRDREMARLWGVQVGINLPDSDF